MKSKSSRIKVELLSFGVTFDKEALTGLGTEFKEEHHGYDDSNWGVEVGNMIPSELMLPGNIVVCVHNRPESTLRVKMEDGKRFIYRGDEKLSRIDFLPRPAVWKKTTSDGVNMKKVINFYGYDCINLNIYSGCDFWKAGMPCKFCSVAPTQKRHQEAVIEKQLDSIREAFETAFRTEKDINFVLTTGGSRFDGNNEVEDQIKVLNIIKDIVPWNTIKGNTALMPPKDLSLIDELHQTGMEHPSFNLEVWGKENFSNICPGKDKYKGYDHIMAAYRNAVRVYGDGGMWCNFVAGINDLKTLKAGFTAMAETGVVPGANVFHPDVGAVLGQKLKSPSPEYIIELFQHAADLYKQYGYKPFFSESVLRNSIANEAFRGWI